MKLTQTQLLFLEKHRISIDQVFDATGLSKSDYHKQMKDQLSICMSMLKKIKTKLDFYIATG